MSEAEKGEQKRPVLIAGCIAAAVLIGIALGLVFPGENSSDFAASGWGPAPVAQSAQATIPPTPIPQKAESVPVEDGFVLIPAGSFLMGSPETENWRIEDETQHEVSLSAFYIDPYETTQADYERLIGVNPSEFTGAERPVESISWLDAIRYNRNGKAAEKSAAFPLPIESYMFRCCL